MKKQQFITEYTETDLNFFPLLGHKAEIDAREDNFGDCVSLGKELLSRNHYASNEIKEKLLELTNLRNEMLHRYFIIYTLISRIFKKKMNDFTKKALIFYFLLRWEERWEHLQLILEVYQFARDAAVAEAWLMAQDPYLKSEELGQTIDEVENLIKKHEAFEKAAAAQEERFAALERLTTVRFYIEGYFFWQKKKNEIAYKY